MHGWRHGETLTGTTAPGCTLVAMHTLPRKNGTGTQSIDANYKDTLKGKVAPLVLQPGDTVVVP